MCLSECVVRQSSRCDRDLKYPRHGFSEGSIVRCSTVDPCITHAARSIHLHLDKAIRLMQARHGTVSVCRPSAVDACQVAPMSDGVGVGRHQSQQVSADMASPPRSGLGSHSNKETVAAQSVRSMPPVSACPNGMVITHRSESTTQLWRLRHLSSAVGLDAQSATDSLDIITSCRRCLQQPCTNGPAASYKHRTVRVQSSCASPAWVTDVQIKGRCQHHMACSGPHRSRICAGCLAKWQHTVLLHSGACPCSAAGSQACGECQKQDIAND